MADLHDLCTSHHPQLDILLLTEIQGKAPHITSLLRNHGYTSHHHLAELLPPVPADLPEARLPNNVPLDPLGCILAYRTSSPWSTYIKKLPPAPALISPRISSILIHPPRTTPILLICTYLPARHDPTSLSKYTDICAHISSLTAQHNTHMPQPS